MDDIVKKRYWQRMKQLSFDHFWQAQNELHSRAYEYAVNHVFEAMGMHPRISKPMIEQVKQKYVEVREHWDACYEVYTAESALEELVAEILEKKYGITKEKAI